jgi:sodium transport system permease protein
MIDAAAVGRVIAKELREARRDRNLILNIVLVPLFLYPLLGFGILQVFQIVSGIGERTATVIAVHGEVPPAVRDSLEAGERVLVRNAPADVDPGSPESFRRWRKRLRDADAIVPDALLAWSHGANGDSARILHDGSRDRSADAKARIESAIESWRRERELAAFESVHLGETDLDRFRIETENTASATQRGREILASGLPLVLLLMLAVGTAAASLDTVVGERERGTLETILVAPLARGDVLVGKYLFVVLAAVTAFALNLLSMSLFLGFVLQIVNVGDEIRISIDPLSFLLMFVAAVLTAALLAAVFMVIAVPSKTYREGQAALSPANLLAMVPGLVVGTSHEPFGLSQAFVPVLNATALFEAALEGSLEWGPVGVTFAVLAATAAAALFVAARIASREDVFLEPRFSLRDLVKGGSRS